MNDIDSQDFESGPHSEELKSWPPELFLTILLPELRTPLIAIKGYTEIPADENMQEHHPQALEFISKKIESRVRLCDDIAAYRNDL